MRDDPGPSEQGVGLRVVIASDKFKGSLDAPAACNAIAYGLRRVAPEADLDICPVADGGEGTAAALAAGGGHVIEREVCGPIPGTRVMGKITLLDDDETAILDMATAAGYDLLDPEHRDPTRTTSFGVGELIQAAIDLDYRKIIVGLGGSATCDAGLGAAQALGLHITLETGLAKTPVTGADLLRIRHVDYPSIKSRARVTCLCDVTNPLFGPDGSAFVFGPQKGATHAQVEMLDAGLRNAANICMRMSLADEPGMGAAGGLAFGLSVATKAELRPGAEAVTEACHLADRLEATQLCITGEGCFDSQSFRGKAVHGVARLCEQRDVPCVVLAGAVGPFDEAENLPGVTAWFSICPGPESLETATPLTARRLAESAEQLLRLTLALGLAGDRWRESRCAVVPSTRMAGSASTQSASALPSHYARW